MKKRIFALLLVFCMLLGCAMPAFAAGGVSDSDTSGITDNDIESVYEAYAAEAEAIEGTEINKVTDAFDDFMEVADIFNEFEDEHYAKLAVLMGCEADEVFSRVLSVHVDAGILAEVKEMVDTFSDDPNAQNAYEFVSYYDELFGDSDYADYQELVLRFFPDIEDICADAKAALPAEDIMKVFEAYVGLAVALESWTYEDVVSAQEKFNEVLDIINEMSEDDLVMLGELLGCSGEEAFSLLLGVNIAGNVIIEMGNRYNACAEELTEENAASFVEYYDAVFNDPGYNDEVLQETVRSFFFDIDDMYQAALEARGFDYVRLFGDNRVETAVAVSEHTFEAASVVVLASGDNYADALAGAPLAYAYGAPILLVCSHTLDAAVLAEIERLEATEIIILGGVGAIGANVENELIEKGYAVSRIWGQTRFETAAEIGRTVKEHNGEEIEEVFFVYSDNFPDALSVSGVAAINGSPILFINGDGRLNSSVAEFVKESNIEAAVVIGGTGIIDESAESNIRANGIENVSRIGGKDRYETCLDIIEKYDDIFVGDYLCIATGENYPDAIVSSVASSMFSSPMLLVNNRELSSEQAEYIGSRQTGTVLVMGGSAIVSDELAQEIADLT